MPAQPIGRNGRAEEVGRLRRAQALSFSFFSFAGTLLHDRRQTWWLNQVDLNGLARDAAFRRKCDRDDGADADFALQIQGAADPKATFGIDRLTLRPDVISLSYTRAWYPCGRCGGI